MGQVRAPGEQKQEQPQAQVIEQFGGLNTKASRPSIGNEEFSWLQNWMPIGDGNLRTLYGEGDTLYTVPNPLQDQIIFEYPFNIGEVSYHAVFLDDGTAYQVQRSNGVITTISSVPGTFYTSGGDLPACAQWQSKYLVIVSTASGDGYWLWDGDALFTAGTLSPLVVMDTNGSGYTSVPTVTAYGGSGSGATFLATIGNNAEEGVVSVDVVNAGSGYLPGEEVTLAFSGGGSDSGAAGIATVTTSSGGVLFVTITNGGSGYTADAVVTFAGGGGSGAIGVISAASSGVITGITITNPGVGYTSAPTVGITAGAGSGFTGVAVLQNGQVTAISVPAGGSGYTVPPEVVISGDGSGATAAATLTGGAVSSVAITNAGTGYTSASIAFVGGNHAARASVTLMPHGVKGNTVETYQSRVWVGDDTVVSFTAPASVSDFSTSSGGGSYAATESFLRRVITRLIQSSGFLYQIADSSINVISNVQTNGDPPTTTFNNANVDPQVGCPWRDSVQAFGRALVFANSSGVYALYGGAAEKVSAALDGLFANATFNTGASGGVTPTAGVGTIFGIRCYYISFTTIDPYTEEQATFMCGWDGQNWHVAKQIKTPIFITTEEIDSELTVWGNDGTNLFPLFQTPNDELEKIYQTRLRVEPAILYRKQANRFYLVAESFVATPPTFDISVDNESGQGSFTSYLAQGDALQFVSNGGEPITFIGTGPIFFNSTSGLGIISTSRSDYGLMLGITGKTTAADCRVLQMTLLIAPQYALNG